MRISLSRCSPFGLSEETIPAEDRNRRTQVIYLVCVVAAVSSLLSGCVTVGVEGANITKDKLVYQANIDAARKGDPIAQYKVGDALCCSINEGAAFYNTQEAVRWLCLSSRQGHGPAMLKVGRILSGDVVDGFRVARRVAHGVMGTTTNLPVAYGWLRAAARSGVPKATERANALRSKMSAQERIASTQFDGPSPPNACTWEEADLMKQAIRQ